jgi:hypothetical protein
LRKYKFRGKITPLVIGNPKGMEEGNSVAEDRNGESIWESLPVKIAVSFVIILFFVVIFLLQREPEQTPGLVEINAKPAQEKSGETTIMPIPERPDAAQPQNTPGISPDILSSQEPPAPAMPGQTVSKIVPPNTPPMPKAEVHQLPAPSTQVHPLSDADEVMGAPWSDVGEVGVTRTYKLPDENGRNPSTALPKKERQP